MNTTINDKPNWRQTVQDIMAMTDKNWTHAKIGAEIGVSRTLIGRLAKNPDADPVFSVGLALIRLRRKLMDAKKTTHGRRRN